MTLPAEPEVPLAAVVLAGGQGRRMGGQDKGLIELAGRPLIEHVLEALRAQAGEILISANRNLERYRRYGVPVVGDVIDGYCGPLAGMLSAMGAIRGELLLTAPCDSPLVAPDYARRMRAALLEADAEVAVARDAERWQPVFVLLRAGLRPSLAAYLESGERKIDGWFTRHRLVEVDFDDRREMFLNLNRPEDRAELEALAR